MASAEKKTPIYPEPLVWMRTFWTKTYPQLASSLPRGVESLHLPQKKILTKENIAHISGIQDLREVKDVLNCTETDNQTIPQGLVVPEGWEGDIIMLEKDRLELEWDKDTSHVGASYGGTREEDGEHVSMEYLTGAQNGPNALRRMAMTAVFFPMDSQTALHQPLVTFEAEYVTPRRTLSVEATIYRQSDNDTTEPSLKIEVRNDS